MRLVLQQVREASTASGRDGQGTRRKTRKLGEHTDKTVGSESGSALLSGHANQGGRADKTQRCVVYERHLQEIDLCDRVAANG